MMYSVPYSHDFHSNWLGLWIHDRDDLEGDEPMFTRMYYRDGFGVRQEYYYDLPELKLFTPGFTAKGSMGSSHKTSIRITFQNNNRG